MLTFGQNVFSQVKKTSKIIEEIKGSKEIKPDAKQVETIILNSSILKSMQGNLNRKMMKSIKTSVTNSIITSIPVTNSKFNYVSIVENRKLKTPYIFFHKFKKGEGTSSIFNGAGQELYKIVISKKGIIDLVLNDMLRTNANFRECMDQCEDEMEADFVGWLAWNTNPTVQVTCAVACAIDNNWMN